MSTIHLKFFLASKFFTVIFQNINIETSHSIGVEKMTDLNTLFTNLKQRNPNQEPFHQAVEEVFMSLDPFFGEKPEIHPTKPA